MEIPWGYLQCPLDLSPWFYEHFYFLVQIAILGLLIGKDSDAGRDCGQEEKGTTEDEMAGWHHRLNGRQFEWSPGVGDGQGGLACWKSWGCKESDMTEWLNWTVFPLKKTDIFWSRPSCCHMSQLLKIYCWIAERLSFFWSIILKALRTLSEE